MTIEIKWDDGRFFSNGWLNGELLFRVWEPDGSFDVLVESAIPLRCRYSRVDHDLPCRQRFYYELDVKGILSSLIVGEIVFLVEVEDVFCLWGFLNPDFGNSSWLYQRGMAQSWLYWFNLGHDKNVNNRLMEGDDSGYRPFLNHPKKQDGWYKMVNGDWLHQFSFEDGLQTWMEVINDN